MQSNLTLSVGFKGGQKMNGVAMYDNNSGIRTVGGRINENNTLPALFGKGVYAPAANTDQFYVGKTSVAITNPVFRGLLLGNDGIRENMPARPSEYLSGSPATAVYAGVLWYDDIFREDGTTLPVVGDQVCLADATGLVATNTGTAGTGFTNINARVTEVIGKSVAIQILTAEEV